MGHLLTLLPFSAFFGAASLGPVVFFFETLEVDLWFFAADDIVIFDLRIVKLIYKMEGINLDYIEVNLTTTNKKRES